MSKRCVILSGGPYYAGATAADGDYVIACDLGYGHALKAGIRPDLVIGDFDSYRGTVDPALAVIPLPVAKDDTDTGYALHYALDRGFDDIVIHYALGARLDHTLANLQSAMAAAQSGASITLCGAAETVRLVSHGSLTFGVRRGQALSVLALTDVCRDVCIEGAAYPLRHAELRSDYPLGVSNQAEGDVTVSVGDGVLFVSLCEA